MASNKAPYYTAAVQSITTGDINGSSNTRYPDLESSMLASSTQMYSLADGALHTHQSSTQIQLEGLLQAATVAAGGEESHYAADGCVMSARFEPKSQLHCQNHAIFDPDQESRSGRTACCTSSNRSHGSGSSLDSPNCPSSYASSSPAPRKRRRINGSAPQQPKRSADGPEQVHNSREASSLAAVSSPLQNACTDAKTAGINSAAALFRSPSSSSKKYTRPPMSKLYASLELSPESFLRLQASAKSYMLNSAYPDRGECVGQRGKGDSELVRLKLWNCVNDFLDQEGQGKSFFGVEASGEDGKARSMIWPQDKNRIIGAVTPLLRRMVTNERQRQYAVETRREGGTGDVKQTGDRPKSLSRRPKDHEDSISKHSESQELSRRLYADIIGGNYENDGFRKDLVARNLASRLDNLKCISGLPEVEFYRIIASVNRRLRALNTRVLHEKTPSEHEEITAQMIESGQAWGHGFSGNGGDSDKSHLYVIIPAARIRPRLTFQQCTSCDVGDHRDHQGSQC